ncbi:hypothetical protein SJAG_00589 [Schizosaccharomyces japonicus yFS275]|uniref:Uncharacterized protein n=1 Tax=Schizosaccharomyces japonicus (strain yFS275 / FY16936) TaxID=402676 RepID=B6JW21_SCHJY|nr:hypothetical protein SJAG_00589 [Schizosaccharomyces japonicus yFS275]EEB05572.1 hypothetical protein SJAG_00589 [Schizosaccharomyces japonicus yFS275]
MAIDNSYGYVPTKWLGIVAVVLFCLAFVTEVAQCVPIRRFLLVVPMIGTLGEIVGWIARLKSSSDPWSTNLFLVNFVALCIAPVFYTAQIYTTMQYLVRLYGPDFSYFSPRIPYRTTIIPGSTESSKLCPPPSRNRKLAIQTLIASTVFVIIRSIYRVVELADGWTGYIVKHEPFFAIFDFVPMFITSILLLGTVAPMLEVRRKVDTTELMLMDTKLQRQFSHLSSMGSHDHIYKTISNPLSVSTAGEKKKDVVL